MKFIATAALLGSLIAGASAAQAMPLAPARNAAALPVIQVAGGCGPGSYRGPSGGCRTVRGAAVVVGPGPVVAGPRVCSPGFVIGRYGRCRPI
ncbi:MAG: hypothetical protein P4M07_19450 [Xanthobacteraceae bacterium]|nr:hypothetical protein [Xanthobacteraceae bacterium]